jgi:ERCC4-type nuclease
MTYTTPTSEGAKGNARPPTLVILADPREQRIPPFPEGVVVERATLAEGDYTSRLAQGIGVIERKSVSDFASSITHSRERFDDEIRRLRNYRWKAIVIEGDLSDVYRAGHVHPHSVLGSIASFFARADLPCLFAVNPSGAGRLIAGVLKRWEERLEFEASDPAPPGCACPSPTESTWFGLKFCVRCGCVLRSEAA